MKEVFNIKRFGALWMKTNRENLKINLIFIAVMVVITFLCLCKFNPFITEYIVVNTEAEKINFLLYYQSLFHKIFWGLLFLFSIVAALRSFKDIVSPYKSTAALLVPASNFEKYLLAFLNSTLIIFVVYGIVFYGIAWLVCAYRYAGVEPGSLTESWFGMHIPVFSKGHEAIRPVVGNVLYIGNISEKFSGTGDLTGQHKLSFFIGNLAVIGWTYVVSIFMWGSITFRKMAALLTLLTHFVVFLGMGYALYRIARHVAETYCQVASLINTVNIKPEFLSPYWFLLLYLLPVTYLGVVWIKLRKKQIN